MVVSTLANWATIVGVPIGAIALLVAAWQIREQRILSRQEKSADVLNVFHDRFQEIARRRSNIKMILRSGAQVDPNEIADYFFHYWAQQLNQWEFFRLGLIPSDVYTKWLMHVADSLRGYEGFDNLISAGEGWERYGVLTMRHQPQFVSFIESVRELASQSAPAVPRVSPEPQLYTNLRKLVRRELARHSRYRRTFGRQ